MYSPTLAPVSLKISELPCFLLPILWGSLLFRKRGRVIFSLLLQFLSSSWTVYPNFLCPSHSEGLSWPLLYLIPGGFCPSNKYLQPSIQRWPLQLSFALLMVLTPSRKQMGFSGLKMRKKENVSKSYQAFKISYRQYKYLKPNQLVWTFVLEMRQ